MEVETLSQTDFDSPTPAFNRLVEMWLHGRSPHTRRAYLRYVEKFFSWCGKPLHTVALADLQGWQDTLVDQSPNSQRLAIAESISNYLIK